MFYQKLLLIMLWIACIHLQAQNTPADYVNPMVGTDFNGHTFPGATVPFGMVQLSPDTRVDGSWEGCSGYHYSDNRIYGFSHTHLSGTGVSDYGDILIMPQTGKGSFEQTEYSATFKHENEWATAGYYSVKLDNGILAELTSTTRVGFHKYTFPQSEFSLTIDLNHRDKLLNGSIVVVDDQSLLIGRVSSAWAEEQHCYAAIKTSIPFEHRFNEDKTKIILTFKASDKELLVKTGLSFVSTDGAQKNLDSELDHWDFEKVQAEAKSSWNKALSKIEVEDKSEEKLRTFYTALYHVMIHPNVAMDVDGSYRGIDQKIHKAEGFTYYTIFSLWDTFRATHPLFTIIERERTLDFIKTLLAMYQEGGRLPVWELCANETDCMIGYHSVSLIADAHAKGIANFDQELAFEAMCASANWDHLGLPEYIEQGFLSVEDEHESVSKTLEYAYDDWCIAQMALQQDKTEEYHKYMLRSNSWRNLLDPDANLMRPRMNGGWLQPFDPREVNNHFTEGNSWQYSFFVPHDVEGMIEAMGGKDAFERKLDALFSAPVQTTGRNQPDISGLVGQYAHGNEPSHHMAYLYNYVNKPNKTKERVHQILRQFYTSKPDGLIGNEDCGQMSAWYVMSAMGLYAVTPGKPEYTIVSPFLDQYTVLLENGNTFTNETISEVLKTDLFIDHFALLGVDSPKRNEPPTDELNYITPPIIRAPSISFDDSLQIDITAHTGCEVRYIIESEGQERSYTPFFISESDVVTAFSFCNNNGVSAGSRSVKARFYKNPHPNWNVKINSTYNPQYAAGGDRGLIDGIHGDENWRKGYWQGYQGQDFEAIVELNPVQPINTIKATFLQDTRSWIIFPTKVDFFGSADGVEFEKLNTNANAIPADDYNVQIQKIEPKLKSSSNFKYIKVVAKNYGILPTWHQGAGGEAFIFVDEIEIN
jgi:predicted alpha-1,2-mannosidase